MEKSKKCGASNVRSEGSTVVTLKTAMVKLVTMHSVRYKRAILNISRFRTYY